MGRLKSLDLAHDPPRVGRRLAYDPARRVLHEQDAEAIAGRGVLDDVDGVLAGAVEEALAFILEIHAQRAVENDDVMRSRHPRHVLAASLWPYRSPQVLHPWHDAGHSQHY